MKTIITILLLTPFFLKAQTINDIPIDSLNLDYIGIDSQMGRNIFKKVIKIDIGQVDKIVNFNDLFLKDENGKNMQFNSEIDAINFFSKLGYELTTGYSVGTNGVYYVMKKINKK